jgi:hypothetical protein
MAASDPYTKIRNDIFPPWLQKRGDFCALWEPHDAEPWLLAVRKKPVDRTYAELKVMQRCYQFPRGAAPL